MKQIPEKHIFTLFDLVDQYLKTSEIKIILDVGARDLVESMCFSEKYPTAKIIAFECNPQTLPICKENNKNYLNIELVDKAVNDYDGVCKFYPINPLKTQTTWEDGNPGASSLFLANGNYPFEKYEQDEIDVNCTRLDTILIERNIDKVDILWMDLQGAELIALRSLGNLLKNVSIICTETEKTPIYTDQAVFSEINNFLKDNFILVHGNLDTDWGTDIIYINKNKII
jgi:FkbM family methyltransferase